MRGASGAWCRTASTRAGSRSTQRCASPADQVGVITGAMRPISFAASECSRLHAYRKRDAIFGNIEEQSADEHGDAHHLESLLDNHLNLMTPIETPAPENLAADPFSANRAGEEDGARNHE